MFTFASSASLTLPLQRQSVATDEVDGEHGKSVRHSKTVTFAGTSGPDHRVGIEYPGANQFLWRLRQRNRDSVPSRSPPEWVGWPAADLRRLVRRFVGLRRRNREASSNIPAGADCRRIDRSGRWELHRVCFFFK